MGNLCGGKNQETEKPKEVKLLLLGSGESGKSTIFKQLKINFENGFMDDELDNYTHSIYANIIHAAKLLCDICKNFKYDFENPKNKEYADSIGEIGDADTALLLTAKKIYTQKVSDMIKSLWADSAIKKAFKHRYDYHIFDGALYFFENLDRISPDGNYVPTHEDILHCRMKTTGIVETDFTMNVDNKKTIFKIIDVGGQRNERRKWINCFEGVTAVMFVSSLADYDQKCYEDDITNRMRESLDLFDEIVNGNYFKEKPVMLVFNKIDVFEKKIAETDLSVFFEDYKDGKDFEKAKKFIVSKFLELNAFDPKRIHVHFSCATNKESVNKVFTDMHRIFNETKEN